MLAIGALFSIDHSHKMWFYNFSSGIIRSCPPSWARLDFWEKRGLLSISKAS